MQGIVSRMAPGPRPGACHAKAFVDPAVYVAAAFDGNRPAGLESGSRLISRHLTEKGHSMVRPLSSAKAPSQRQLKVGELIRHVLAEIFARGEIVDDVLTQCSLTVSEVRMSPDLKLATIYVLPLGGAGAEDAVKHLDQHKRYLRGEVARRVSLKFMPELRFKTDTSFAASQRIDELLASPKVVRDLDG